MSRFKRIALRVVLPWCIGLSVVAIVALPSEYNHYNPLLVLWWINRLIYVVVNPIPEEARFGVFLFGAIALGYMVIRYNDKPIAGVAEKWHYRVRLVGFIACLLLVRLTFNEAKLHAVKPWYIQGPPIESYVENGYYPLMRRFPSKSECERFLTTKAITGARCVYDADSMYEESNP